MMANNTNTNLVGCHLFLQVFFLDNVDLGMFNKKHDVLPRISVFDQTSIRRMITMTTDIGKGATSYSNCKIRHGPDVCYARCKYPDCIEKTSNHPAGAANLNQVYGQHTDERAGSVHASSSSAAHLLDVQTPLRVLGPIDFVEHLRSRYPSLAMDELTILLKEQNARC